MRDASIATRFANEIAWGYVFIRKPRRAQVVSRWTHRWFPLVCGYDSRAQRCRQYFSLSLSTKEFGPFPLLGYELVVTLSFTKARENGLLCSMFPRELDEGALNSESERINPIHWCSLCNSVSTVKTHFENSLVSLNPCNGCTWPTGPTGMRPMASVV
jgi:hypothetical protein